MLKKFIFAGLGLALMSMFAVANATPMDPVIYDNGSPDTSLDSIGSDRFSPNEKAIADDFTSFEHMVITDVHWWGYFRDDEVGDTTTFALGWFNDGNGAPGTAVDPFSFEVQAEVMAVDGQTNAFGWQLLEFWVDIEPIKLGAGTFWLSIVSKDLETGDFFIAVSSDELAEGPLALNAIGRFIDPTEPWGSVEGLDSGFDMAFNLTGKIPEPAALALFGFGLMGIGLARRRRRTV